MITATAWAIRAADSSSAAWKSIWYSGEGWYSTGSDSA